MNFLLHMLGRAAGLKASLRPLPREVLVRRAGHAAATGDMVAARACYQTLADDPAGEAIDSLICAQLHLMCEEHVEAAIGFSDGMARLQRTVGSEGTPSALGALFRRSDELLVQGRCAEAAEMICRGRALTEILLAAEAGLFLAGADAVPLSAMEALCRLSDLSLRLLTRTQIADQLAVALRRRHLDHALAPWATSSESVQELLESHLTHFTQAGAHCPSDAESCYRLGLVASALGRAPLSADAFARVLALHPHHVSSAVRLAIANAADAVSILRRALTIPAATLHLFAAFAHAAADPGALDATAEMLCERGNSIGIRASLNFVLAELALTPTLAPAGIEGTMPTHKMS